MIEIDQDAIENEYNNDAIENNYSVIENDNNLNEDGKQSEEIIAAPKQHTRISLIEHILVFCILSIFSIIGMYDAVVTQALPSAVFTFIPMINHHYHYYHHHINYQLS